MRIAFATLITLAFTLCSMGGSDEGRAFPGNPPAQQGGPRQHQSGATARGSTEMWVFQPDRDSFRADALLDLRALNEKVAGQSGFVRLSTDKNEFVKGDGAAIRFWGVNFGIEGNPPVSEFAHAARFLAKRGVNMVRSNISIEARDRRLTDADTSAIDKIWRLEGAMKKEGIYTTITPYWANALAVPRSWGIEGWPDRQAANGLLFFNPQLQEGYKAWLKALLVPRNPYTGIPLAQDPAVAVIQLQNEDSLLFWTEHNIKGKQLELLGKKFGDWAVSKYGSIDKALEAWKGAGKPADDPARRAGRPDRLGADPGSFGPGQEAARRSASVPRRDNVPLQQGNGALSS